MSGSGVPRAGIFDLRQYTLHPGRRDDLVELFDEHLVTGQEAVGMHIVGQFRDLDDPDRFVWLRAFDSWTARGEALPAFYYGPVWQAHRDRANETMADSDDALLLSPVRLGSDYSRYGTPRAEPVDGEPRSVVGITVVYRDRPIDAAFTTHVLDDVLPLVADAGGQPLAVLVTDPSPNNFPALPLRDENVVVWINRFDDDATYARHRAALDAMPAWTSAWAQLQSTARLPIQQLRLRPTGRSHLR